MVDSCCNKTKSSKVRKVSDNSAGDLFGMVSQNVTLLKVVGDPITRG